MSGDDIGAMEDWWAELDDTVQAAWLTCWEAGRADPDLVDTLPPERRPSRIGAWVSQRGIQSPGQPDVDWHLALDETFNQFLGEEYDRRREE